MVFYIVFVVQRLNMPTFFLQTSWVSSTNLHSSLPSWGKILVVSRPPGIMNSEVRLGSLTYRKVDMVTQATIQALAKYFPT